MKHRKILSAVLAVGMCLSLAGCSKEPTQETSLTDSGETAETSLTDSGETAETVITLSESWDFSAGIAPSLNPSNSSNYGAIYWGRNFYNTLVKYNENNEIEGELASSWDISEDGKSYTFHLREDILFSDGSPLTAEAVKTSFEAAVFNLGEYNGSYGMLSALFDTIEVVDENTVTLHLIQPYYGTLNDLSMCCPLAIINPVAFDGAPDLSYGDAFKQASFGTGPYMYAGNHENDVYTFVKNPYYWGEEPEVDVFKVKTIEDNDAKLLALRSGEIDAILASSQISFDGAVELSAAPAFDIMVDDGATISRLLGMNLTTAPFDDVLVRQAVAYAIDQSLIESSVFNGFESAAETLFPEDTPFCSVEQTVYNTDIEKARALMEQAGWVDSDGDGVREKDGSPCIVELHYITSLASIDNLAMAIVSQLGEIGIKVNVTAGDMMTYYAAMNSSPLLLANSYGGAFDPYTFVTNINPAVSTDPLTVQYAAFLPENIVVELNATADMNRIQEIYDTILTTIADQCLLVPLTYSHEMGIWNSEKIAGYDFCIDGRYIDISGIRLK